MNQNKSIYINTIVVGDLNIPFLPEISVLDRMSVKTKTLSEDLKELVLLVIYSTLHSSKKRIHILSYCIWVL